jgi:hypothetical protein
MRSYHNRWLSSQFASTGNRLANRWPRTEVPDPGQPVSSGPGRVWLQGLLMFVGASIGGYGGGDPPDALRSAGEHGRVQISVAR